VGATKNSGVKGSVLEKWNHATGEKLGRGKMERKKLGKGVSDLGRKVITAVQDGRKKSSGENSTPQYPHNIQGREKIGATKNKGSALISDHRVTIGVGGFVREREGSRTATGDLGFRETEKV